MLTKLYWSAAVYTALGLVGGLYYREFTKAHAWTGGGQLGLVHTHFLVLGTVVFLLLLGLEKAFTLSESSAFRTFFLVYNIGLVITATMLTVKGTLQVLESSVATSAALAGVAGLGHMTLATGFVLLFVALKSRITALGQSVDGARVAVAVTD